VRLRGGHERPERQRAAHPAALHEHPARAANGAAVSQYPGQRPTGRVVLITDGLPTAHFEGHFLYLLYPPDPKTEEATMREGRMCHREGITINTFLLTGWAQSSETCSSPTGWPNRPRGACSSPPGRDSTARGLGLRETAAEIIQLSGQGRFQRKAMDE